MAEEQNAVTVEGAHANVHYLPFLISQQCGKGSYPYEIGMLSKEQDRTTYQLVVIISICPVRARLS